MNLEQWIDNLKTCSEIEKTDLLFDKIQSKSIEPLDTYFEYLIIRLIGGINSFKKLQFSMKLDKNFEPICVAPGGKADLIITFDVVELVGEVTLRPVSGKVDHFSHITDISKQLGFLFVQDIQKVDPQVWNTYKVYSNETEKFFMICDVKYIHNLLLSEQSTSHQKLLEFIKKSKEIWLSESSWKNIREKIIQLTA